MTQRTPESKDAADLTAEAAQKPVGDATEAKDNEGVAQAAGLSADIGGSEGAKASESPDAAEAKAEASGQETSSEANVQALRRQAQEAQAALEAAVREKDELFDRWLRLQAEFDNFRKRTRKEMEESRSKGAEDLVVKLLPVIDNLERAIASAENEPSIGLAEGVRMIHKQFLTVLEGVGVTPIQAIGNPFDPNLHEAVAYETSDEYPEGTVMEELLRGYILGEKVLRASMVKVSGGSGNKEETKSNE